MPGEHGERHAHSEASLTEQPYLGLFGRTRHEQVQVWMPDGSIRSMSVCVAVDAVADPTLAAQARAGLLHDVDDGVVLAVPFVYHDPSALLLVLVIPTGLRHRAFALRAEHLALVAADTSASVPDYVRDLEVVFGATELAARVEGDGESRPSTTKDLSLLDLRAVRLVERERRLERRERLIDARERALERIPSSRVGRVLDSELEEVHDGDEIDPDATVIAANVGGYDNASALDDDAELDAADEVEEVEDVGPDEPIDALDDDADVDDVAEEAAQYERPSRSHALAPPIVPDEAIPLAPEEMLDDPSVELALRVHAQRAWLFVRNRPAESALNRDVDLLVQVDPDAPVAVVLLSLVFGVGANAVVRRGVVDLDMPDQSDALTLLAEKFEIQLVGLEADESVVHWAVLHGARGPNVAAVLSHLRRVGRGDRQAFLTARNLLLASPPPLRDRSHPFDADDSERATSATEAAVAVDELAPWLVAPRRERLSLLLSVPDAVVEVHTRRVIEDALDYGLALPAPLRDAALLFKLAADEGALLKRRLEGLCRTSRDAELSGLEEPVLRTLWADALEAAVREGVTVSDEARTLARKHADARALAHLDVPAEPHDAALDPARTALAADAPDPEQLAELSARGGYGDLVALARAATRLSAEQMTRLFARIAKRRDVTALDALEAILATTDDERVRVGVALALAVRRAPSSIAVLAKQLAKETTPAWQAFALALGRYGGGSLRAISRELADAQVAEERILYVYAHLALHGARAQIRAKTRGADAEQARLAERALALAGELKDMQLPIQGVEQQAWLTVFCESFDQHVRKA
jgi:chromosome segregation protein